MVPTSLLEHSDIVYAIPGDVREKEIESIHII